MKFTYSDFLQRSTQAHGNKFDYSKVVFVNTTTKITITCPIHGEFTQLPYRHYTTKSGCPSCGPALSGNSRINKPNKGRGTKANFIEKANLIHDNKYSYEAGIYTTTHNKITITCPLHGAFEQQPIKHLKGQGCPKCAASANANSMRKTTEQFINSANTIHNNTYTYENTIYIKYHTKVSITCAEHGNFEQTPAAHISGKQGCPKCANEKQGFTPEKFKNKKAIFYILQLKNGLFKPGITTQKSVEKRYNQDSFSDIVQTILFEQHFFDGKHARTLEIELFKRLAKFKFKGEQVFPKVKNTEILTVNPITELTKLILEDMSAYKLDNK